MSRAKRDHLSFFIDYVDADLQWVKWIVWQLEDAGYSVVYRGRDFRAGMNIGQKTNEAIKKAQRVMIVLSPDYLKAPSAPKKFSGATVWSAVLSEDTSGQGGNLLPLRVRICEPKGLLGSLLPIELLDLDETQARKVLLDGVSQELPMRGEKPIFPGDVQLQSEQRKPHFPSSYRPDLWEIPHENPFFTDREDELTKLYEALFNGLEGRVHTHVINGLGGIGKTQVALAYAYEYRHLYNAALWIDFNDERSLQVCITRLVRVLNLKLSQSERKNMQDIWIAVKHWLEEHENWLLIVDNIDDPRSIRDFLPSLGNGHVLFTAQTQIIGGAVQSMFPLPELKPEDGALFLLKRTGMRLQSMQSVSEHMRNEAVRLSQMLGNLPLMLDQAGGYIEDTGSNVSRYLEWYSNSTDRGRLLRKRGSMAVDHLASIIETWDQAFTEAQQSSPAAFDLLRFCAFVHHTAIPEEIVSRGAAEIIPALQVFARPSSEQAEAFFVLRKYSLLAKDGDTHTYTMNRMVQEVLKDKMSKEEQRLWAERAIIAVARTFLGYLSMDSVVPGEQFCLRYFSHVHACTTHMQEWDIGTPESSQLLYQMGVHLHDYFQAYHLVSVLEHERILEALVSYAALLKKMERDSEANKLIIFAEAIRAMNEQVQNAS